MIIVRSQDKMDLLKVEMVCLGTGVLTDENEVVGITAWGSKVVLGKYKSKDRAMKVLDLIHKQIETETTSDKVFNGVRTVRNRVFSMPRE